MAVLPTPGPALIQKIRDLVGDVAGEFGRIEHRAQTIDVAFEFTCFALQQCDDLNELLFVPACPVFTGNLAVANVAPLAEVLPLQVTDGDRRCDILHRFEQNRIKGAKFIECHSYFVEAYSGIAGGVFGEKGQSQIAIVNALGDLAAPIVPCVDLFIIDPHGVAALFQIRFKTIDKFFVVVVTVTEEDGFWGFGFVVEIF